METQRQSAQKSRVAVKEPDLYDVILLNDDFTTMEFVVIVLRTVFRKTAAEAESLMMRVHRAGSAVAGTYTLDIAKSKVAKTEKMARDSGFPLRLNIRRHE